MPPSSKGQVKGIRPLLEPKPIFIQNAVVLHPFDLLRRFVDQRGGGVDRVNGGAFARKTVA